MLCSCHRTSSLVNGSLLGETAQERRFSACSRDHRKRLSIPEVCAALAQHATISDQQYTWSCRNGTASRERGTASWVDLGSVVTAPRQATVPRNSGHSNQTTRYYRGPTAPVNYTKYRDTLRQVPSRGCSSLEPRWLGVSYGVELTQAHSQDVPRSIEVAVPIDVAVCAHLQAVTFPVSIRS